MYVVGTTQGLSSILFVLKTNQVCGWVLPKYHYIQRWPTGCYLSTRVLTIPKDLECGPPRTGYSKVPGGPTAESMEYDKVPGISTAWNANVI